MCRFWLASARHRADSINQHVEWICFNCCVARPQFVRSWIRDSRLISRLACSRGGSRLMSCLAIPTRSVHNVLNIVCVRGPLTDSHPVFFCSIAGRLCLWAACIPLSAVFVMGGSQLMHTIRASYDPHDATRLGQTWPNRQDKTNTTHIKLLDAIDMALPTPHDGRAKHLNTPLVHIHYCTTRRAEPTQQIRHSTDRHEHPLGRPT